MSGVIEEIDLADLEALLEQGAVLVDVREQEEVDEGMIEGAVHMPLSEFENFSEDISKTHPTVFYCRSGRRSLKAAELASEWTDQPLYSLGGGYLGYSEQS